MNSIVQRYLALEILKSSTATTLILFTILMSNTLGSILSDISNGDTPAEALYPVLLGQSVRVLSLVLPLSFFLGVVFAFGRFYKDHELIVLHACGYGYRQLYKPMLVVLFPVLVLTAISSLWLSSEMQRNAKSIIDDKKNVHEIQQMKVGQFNISNDKKHVFFMRELSEDKLEMRDVIITQKLEGQSVLEKAQRGRNKLDDKTGNLFLELGPGRRYEGLAGQADYKIIDFETHGILLKQKQATISPLKDKEKSLREIYYSDLPLDKKELFWRMAYPVALIVLAMLAVPLSYIAPRQGRYGKIGVALLVFIGYLILLGISKSALEQDKIPLWLNYWWVHGVFVLITILVLRQRLGKPLFLSWRRSA